ncbi:MAG: restriction endonuclease subunit S [Prevotella sp.]|nr:restriction endonuclease subunit S [Prevotella sp.]
MSEWKKVKLGEVATIFSGFAFKSKDMNKISGIPLIKIKNINNFAVSKECDSYLNTNVDLAKLERFKLQQIDFLIAMTGQGSVGRVGKMMDYSPAYYVNQRVAIVRPIVEKVNSFFLYKCLATNDREKELFNKANGAGQPNISPAQIGDLDLLVPSLVTQNRIATILSRYDSLIENYQKQIKLLEEAAQRLYKEWFVDLHFPGHENTKIVDGVPEGWEYYRIGERYKTVLGGTPSRANLNYWGGNIPWINSGEINKLRVIGASEMITQEGYDNSSTKLMPVHTTILAITGATLGQVSYTEIETCANQSVVGIIDESNETNEYLYLNISNNILSIVNKATGGAQQHINKDIVNDYPILIPDDKTLKSFKELVGPSFALIKELLLSIESLTEARDRLLPKLMGGEIEV